MSDLIDQALREADRLALTDEPYAAQVIRELVARIAKVEAELDRWQKQAQAQREARQTVQAATIERCAQVVDQCNREGPYNAIGAASLIRALKPSGEGQSERPVNPYLLGGSSTEAEG